MWIPTERECPGSRLIAEVCRSQTYPYGEKVQMVIKLSVLTQSTVQKRAEKLKPVVEKMIEEIEMVERIELIAEQEEIVTEKLGIWDSIKSWLIRIKEKLFHAD